MENFDLVKSLMRVREYVLPIIAVVLPIILFGIFINAGKKPKLGVFKTKKEVSNYYLI